MKSFKMPVILASLLFMPVFGQQKTQNWGFDIDPSWQTNDPTAFRWSDTTILSLDGDTSKGIYSSMVRVGDSSFLSEDLRPYGFFQGSVPQFYFTAFFEVQKLDLYSALFLGVSDISHKTPYGNSGAAGIMVGLGRVYEGPFFGLYASNGITYFSRDSVNQVTDLLEEGKKYLVRCSTEASFVSARLFRAKDDSLIAAVKVSFNPYDYYSLSHFTATVKGYQGAYGSGYAVLKGALDSLSFTGAYSPATVIQGRPAGSGASGISISPNPFRTVAGIRLFGMEKPRNARLGIHDLAGKGIALLEPSNGEFRWEPRNLAPGIYLARFSMAGKSYSKALVLLP